MKMRCLAFALGLMAGAAPAFAADPVAGNWTTQPDDNGHFGMVAIESCGAKICGTLVRAFDGQGKQIPSDNIGRQIVWDMQPAGAGKYTDGKIYAPDRGKTYDSKMTLSGDTLQVYGCVFFICRGQVWSRAK